MGWSRCSVARAWRTGSAWALACAYACACATALAGAAPASAASGGDAHARAAKVAERAAALQHQADVLDFRVVDLSRQLRYAQQEYDDVTQTRDDARALLTADLVNRYRAGEDASPIALVLGSRNIDGVLNTLRLHRELSAYEARLVQQLDVAADGALAQKSQAEQLASTLVATQSRADSLRSDAETMLAAEARRQAERDAHRRAAAAARERRKHPERVLAAAGLGDPFGGGVTTLAGMTLPPAGMLPAAAVTASSLDAYLYSKGSPMAGQGTFILLAAQRWAIDPRLIVAISGAESNFGAQTCGNFNAWGWACPNSPAQFENWADGINTIAEGLRTYYLDDGRTTVALIQQKWAPSGAANDPTGLNNNWVANVSRFLLEQGGDPNSLSMGVPLGTSALAGVAMLGNG